MQNRIEIFNKIKNSKRVVTKENNQDQSLQESVQKARVRVMVLEDIPSIVAIEEASFPIPWTEESFTSEIKDNCVARYFCLEKEGNVIGYMGLWLVVGEAHVTNIAIWPGCRGQGWGEYLMRGVMQSIVSLGVLQVTLEVRVTNTTAQQLYTKLGFKPAGVRKRYYSDNQEDAIIMWASL